MKGGIKAFTKIILGERVPSFICLKATTTNEKLFLKALNLSLGTIAVFDKGFQKFSQYAQWTAAGIYYVTRLNANGKFKILENLELKGISKDGVIPDNIIALSYHYTEQKNNTEVECRMVAYIDPASKKELVFVTNLFTFKPLTISILYIKRWMLEPLFKQIKQNFQLTYFLADSEEGIKTKLWMAMKLNLLFTVIHKMIKEAEDFSTLVKLAAKNLYSYVNLIAFIKNPKNVRKATRESIGVIQLSVFENTNGG